MDSYIHFIIPHLFNICKEFFHFLYIFIYIFNRFFNNLLPTTENGGVPALVLHINAHTYVSARVEYRSASLLHCKPPNPYSDVYCVSATPSGIKKHPISSTSII